MGFKMFHNPIGAFRRKAVYNNEEMQDLPGGRRLSVDGLWVVDGSFLRIYLYAAFCWLFTVYHH